MTDYGIDKPDTRYGMKLVDLTAMACLSTRIPQSVPHRTWASAFPTTTPERAVFAGGLRRTDGVLPRLPTGQDVHSLR